MHRTPDTTALVVAERGSDWTPWVDVMRRGSPDVLVVLQQPGESVEALAHRVRVRVGAVVEGGGRLATAVIAGGGRTDDDAISARSHALRAIVAPMVTAAGGRIYLSARATDRFAMMGLAGAVAPMVEGTGVRVMPVGAEPTLPAVA